MRYLVALLMLVAAPVFARDSLQAIPTTPDLSIGASASGTFLFQSRADWIHIRNNCSSTVYFMLNPASADLFVANDFYLRLASNEVFEGDFVVRSVGASNSSNSAACTFTVIIGRH